MSWTVATPPAVEPVDVGQLKDWLRIQHGFSDTELTLAIQVARESIEQKLHRGLINQTITYQLNVFAPQIIELPIAPASSITTVQYVDLAGDTQTWAASNYIFDGNAEPGFFTPAHNVVFPSTRAQVNAVTVTYVAGYGATGTSVPAPLRQAIMFLVGHWDLNRLPVVTGTIATELPLHVEDLLNNYVWEIAS